jgi:2-oxoglutarate dehydrogenase E2 component (dihydrolipoamide succinyltransferase)
MEVTMPDLGEGVSEGIVTRWYRKAGDTIRAGEPLVDVETDKTTTEVPAPAAGVLVEILAEEGAVAAVGSRIAVIRET